MKKQIYSLFLLVFVLASCNNTDNGKYDERAINSLDKMSEVIGEINSCSFLLSSTIVKYNTNQQEVNLQIEHDVYLQGPNKLFIKTNGTIGRKSYWYNGEIFSYYSYVKNQYDTIAVTGNIIEIIDFLHHKYDIIFPAADFFYPSLTDDILTNFHEVYYDETSIDEIDCIEITALSSTKNINIWIDKNTNLPYRFDVNIENGNPIKTYVAYFSNWKINPVLPDNMFEFTPPAGAKRVIIEPKN